MSDSTGTATAVVGEVTTDAEGAYTPLAITGTGDCAVGGVTAFGSNDPVNPHRRRGKTLKAGR